jgi:hypothetical protein
MPKVPEIGGTADDEQPPAIGSRVELYKHVYGHVAGAQGVVVRVADNGKRKVKAKVLVRFDDTGYAIFVPCEALKQLA